jgi:O-antigen/teichoic acid export membrane protein
MSDTPKIENKENSPSPSASPTPSTNMAPSQSPKTPSFKKNYLFNLIVQVLTYLIPLITSPYLSRVLTPTGIGTNSFANSIANYFTLIIAFGYLTYGTKEVSRLHESKKEYSVVFWNIVFSRLFLFVLAFPTYFLMAYLWGFGSSIDKNVFLIYSLTLVSTLLTITFLFQGLENFKTISLITISVKIVAAVLYFLLVKEPDDLFIYIAIYVSANAAIALLSWIFALRKVERPHFKDIHIFRSLRSNISYFLPTIAISVYTMLDHTMLGYLSTTEEVGYYEEAYKVISVVTGLVSAISPVILARISALIQEGNEAEVEHKIVQVGELYALIAFPSFFGIYAIASYFIPAFFGESYVPSVQVLYWLIPLVVIIPISSIIGNAYYVPRDKIKMTTWFLLAGAVVNFTTNFFAIHYMAAQGAAITSLIAESIISLLYVLFSFKKMPYKKIIKTFLKPAIAAVLMFVVLMLLNTFVLDPYVTKNVYKTLIDIGVGVVIYGSLCILLKEPFVRSALRRVFKKKA